MKTVAIVINRMGVGGAERLVVEDIVEFVKRGWRVHLITFSKEHADTFMNVLPKECVRDLVPFKNLYDISGLMHLRKRLREIDPDIIVSHMWYANILTRIASTFAGYRNRTLLFEQNIATIVKTWKQVVVDFFLQSWCRSIIAVSPEVRESLIKKGIDASRIKVIMMAIDPAPIRAAVPTDIRAELSLHHEFIYLFVGRLTRQKAIDTLLDAFAHVPTGVLLIAGKGEERARLMEQAESFGITRRVYFLDVRSDAVGLMKGSDCFVFPSRWEAFGMVMLEAMAAGVPIIVSDFPTALEMVENEVSALVFPREDTQALTQAMMRMQSDPALRRRLKANVATNLGRFSTERHVDNILAAAGY